ncbi:hypothetical protein Hdeb2414_s0004g00138331 [Helianthus debilis subsp. tardiflorus]
MSDLSVFYFSYVFEQKDIHVQFSKLTQTDIDQFCVDYGIDPTLETQVPGDKTANECPTGFLVFYTRIVDQPNLRYPFTNFFLEVLKYYRLSWGQLAPVGVSRIMHFEILCRDLTYEHSLLMFRCFFRLAWNSDWYTIEKTQCEAPLLSHTEPGVNDLDQRLLIRLRAYRSKLRAYPEELLVMLGISQDWAESGFEPVVYLNDKDECLGLYLVE